MSTLGFLFALALLAGLGWLMSRWPNCIVGIIAIAGAVCGAMGWL